MIGSVTFWDPRKKYGFISVINSDGTLKQYFFHFSNFKGSPMLGAVVVFKLGAPVAVGKKIQAVDVRYATPADVQSTEKIEASVDVGTDALAGGTQ